MLFEKNKLVTSAENLMNYQQWNITVLDDCSGFMTTELSLHTAAAAADDNDDKVMIILMRIINQ